MQVSNYEKETIINFNEMEKTASVYTYNNKLIKKLKECCKKFPNEYKLIEHNKQWGSYKFEVPKKRVTINIPKATRILTEEEKQELRERLLKIRSK